MFFVGFHQPSDAKHFDRAFVSVNRLRGRKKAVAATEWIMEREAKRFIETLTAQPIQLGWAF